MDQNLHHILWMYQMIPRIPMEEIPFNLAFGTKAGVGVLFAQVENFDQQINSERWLADLDLLVKPVKEHTSGW